MNRRELLTGGAAAAGALGLASIASAQPLPGSLSAVWVHGTSVEPEDMSIIKRVTRVGWGADFRTQAGKFAWFHVSIATPVVIENVRPKLEKIFVFYKTSFGEIRNVHVYDGPRKVRAFDNLHLQGDHSGGIDPSNSWAVNPPLTIAFGLGISIGVQFSIGIDSPIDTGMLFTTAGADFRFSKP
jgi:hypothetical protein